MSTTAASIPTPTTSSKRQVCLSCQRDNAIIERPAPAGVDVERFPFPSPRYFPRAILVVERFGEACFSCACGCCSSFMRSTLPLADASILNLQDAVGGVDDDDIVSDYKQTYLQVVADGTQQVGYIAPGDRVQVAGRLIGYDEARFMHQRSRQGHTLLFSIRKLQSTMMHARTKSDALQGLAGASCTLAGLHPHQAQGNFDILLRGQRGKKVGVLKHHANALTP